jgi:hypothetical protein
MDDLHHHIRAYADCARLCLDLLYHRIAVSIVATNASPNLFDRLHERSALVAIQQPVYLAEQHKPRADFE